MAGAASEVRSYAVTVPAGTAQAAPYSQDVSFPARLVQWVRWRVPPGPSGLLGWRLTMAGNQVIPRNSGEWIVADDEGDTWQVDQLPDSGAWTVTAYNTGANDHTVYLAFGLAVLPAPSASDLAANSSVLDTLTASAVTT